MTAPVLPPGTWSLPRINATVPVRRIEDTLLQDPILNPARRAGRFIKMAMLAAADCLHDAALDAPARERMGLVLVTGMGAHDINFGFVDGLLEFGMNQGSPTLFSHSVHNATTSYIAAMSGSRGPALTITHFVSPLHQGLDAASLLLDGGTCDHVLLGAVDELGAFMLAIYAARGMIAQDGILHTKVLDAPIGIVPGEGAAFFLLTRSGESGQRRCQITRGVPVVQPVTRLALDHDGLRSEGAVIPLAVRDIPAVCHSELWGSFPCGSGMALAASILDLEQTPAAHILLHTHRPGVDPIEISA
jgi:3-oxoacyl-(acyl-carrier-protein) synthase